MVPRRTRHLVVTLALLLARCSRGDAPKPATAAATPAAPGTVITPRGEPADAAVPEADRRALAAARAALAAIAAHPSVASTDAPPALATQSAPPAGIVRGSVVLNGITPMGESGLDPGVVAQIVRAALAGYRACYERALRTAPTLAGTVALTFTIGERGRVLASPPVVATGLDLDVTGCIMARTRTLVFPADAHVEAGYRAQLAFTPER